MGISEDGPHCCNASAHFPSSSVILMGRSSTKSVARVYADVNAKLGPSWHEYGTQRCLGILLVLFLTSLCFTDNLQVQWGSQDHYEIVRKVGRGKYSEVRHANPITFERRPHGTIGVRRHQCCHRGKVYRQGPKTREKEENQARNQDPTESGRGTQCCRAFGCRSRSSVQDTKSDHRIRPQC